MATQTQIVAICLTIHVINSISEPNVVLENIEVDVSYNTTFGLMINIFSTLKNISHSFQYFFDDEYLSDNNIEETRKTVQKLIDVIKLDNLEEIVNLHRSMKGLIKN